MHAEQILVSVKSLLLTLWLFVFLSRVQYCHLGYQQLSIHAVCSHLIPLLTPSLSTAHLPPSSLFFPFVCSVSWVVDGVGDSVALVRDDQLKPV